MMMERKGEIIEVKEQNAACSRGCEESLLRWAVWPGRDPRAVSETPGAGWVGGGAASGG